MSDSTKQPVPKSADGLLTTLRRSFWAARRRLGLRLVAILMGSLVILLGATGWLALGLHRQHLFSLLEQTVIGIGETILFSAHSSMLENDRDRIDKIIQSIGRRENILALRLLDAHGEVRYSNRSEEVGQISDIGAPLCQGCHTDQGIRYPQTLRDGLQLYSLSPGEGALGLGVPVMNADECWSEACHVHPADQRVLGILDLEFSTLPLDTAMRDASRQMTIFGLITILVISAIIGVLAWRVVNRPIHSLLAGTRRVGSGDLAYRIRDISPGSGEIGELASAFNEMSSRLQAAQTELEEWNQLLEAKVKEKTRQLDQTRDQVIFAQKMASLGKLAAVVAHEINNPLAGILVYTKLVRRQLKRLCQQQAEVEQRDDYRDLDEKLNTVESGVARCGDIVRNLLLFSRHRERKRAPANINTVVRSSLKLVQHQADLGGIDTELDLDPDLPEIICEMAQIQQAVVAAIMNGLEAMPNGGSLRLRTWYDAARDEIRIDIEDTGVGIPEELRTRIFEPFFTTKDEGKGTGLGLSVMYGIIHRGQGRIEFDSAPGKGTTFHLFLPVHPSSDEADEPSPAPSEKDL